MRFVVYSMCWVLALSMMPGCGGGKDKEQASSNNSSNPVSQTSPRAGQPAETDTDLDDEGLAGSNSLRNGLFPQAGAGTYPVVFNTSGTGGGLFPQRGTEDRSQNDSPAQDGNSGPSAFSSMLNAVSDVVRGGGSGDSGGMRPPRPVKQESEYGELYDKAGELFQAGEGEKALDHVYAFMLTNDKAMNEFPMRWHSTIKRPRVALRWGVGVVRGGVDDERAPVIGEPVEDSDSGDSRGSGRGGDSRGGGRGGDARGGGRGGQPQPTQRGGGRGGDARGGGRGGAVSSSGGSGSDYEQIDASTPTGLLLYYTGDFGEQLINEFEDRRQSQAYFGRILKDMPMVLSPAELAAADGFVQDNFAGGGRDDGGRGGVGRGGTVTGGGLPGNVGRDGVGSPRGGGRDAGGRGGAPTRDAGGRGGQPQPTQRGGGRDAGGRGGAPSRDAGGRGGQPQPTQRGGGRDAGGRGGAPTRDAGGRGGQPQPTQRGGGRDAGGRGGAPTRDAGGRGGQPQPTQRGGGRDAGGGARENVTFENDIKPILQQRCASCHNPSKRRAGLDVTNYDNLMQGGDEGTPVEPGNASGSYLYALVTHAEEPVMPPNGNKIPQDEINLIGQWIDGGALETIDGSAAPSRGGADRGGRDPAGRGGQPQPTQRGGGRDAGGRGGVPSRDAGGRGGQPQPTQRGGGRDAGGRGGAPTRDAGGRGGQPQPTQRGGGARGGQDRGGFDRGGGRDAGGRGGQPQPTARGGGRDGGGRGGDSRGGGRDVEVNPIDGPLPGEGSLVERWAGNAPRSPRNSSVGELSPGLIGLGEGSRDEIAERARENNVDCLLLVQINGAKRRGTLSSMTRLRLVDAQTAKRKLAETSNLSNVTVMNARADGKKDQVADQLSKFFEDEAVKNLRAADMPNMNSEVVLKRVNSIVTAAEEPLRDAVEVIWYYREGLLPEGDAISALDTLLDGNGDVIINGSEKKRVEAIKDLLK